MRRRGGERRGEVPVAAAEPLDDVVERRRRPRRRQREDVGDDAGRPSLAFAGEGVAGHEQLGDHPRRVGHAARPDCARRASDGHRRPRAMASSVLQRGDQRERRLGALVEVGAVALRGRRSRRRVEVPHRARRRRWRRGTSRRAASMPSRHACVAGDGVRPGRRRRPSPRPRSAAGRTSAAGRRRAGAADRRSATGGRRRSRGRAASAAASSPSSRTSGRSRSAPAAMSASGSDRVGVRQPRLGPRPAGSAPGRPIDVDGVGEQRAGPRRVAGRRRAPRRRRARRTPSPAATATAARAPRSKYDARALAHPRPRAPGARGAERPQLRPQQSSTPRRPLPPPPAARRLRTVPSTPWASARNRNAVAPRPTTAAVGVRLAAGRDEQPGHVVGAVAVADARARRGRRARTCRCRRSSPRCGRRTAPGAIMRRPPSASQQRRGELVVAAGDRGHDSSGASRRPRRPSRCQALGVGRRRRGSRRRAPPGRAAGTTIPAPLAEQLDGVREGGGDDRPAGGDGVDEHARGDLVLGVVGQHDEVGAS